MSRLIHQHEGLPPDSFEQLRHDLLNPLATIRGRAQLLTRAVIRTAGLEEEDRARLLRGLAAIDEAVIAAVEVLDHADLRQDNSQGEDDH